MALREADVRLELYDTLYLTSLPVLCRFEVYYCTRHQEPLRQANEPDDILNAWLPPESEIEIAVLKDGVCIHLFLFWLLIPRRVCEFTIGYFNNSYFIAITLVRRTPLSFPGRFLLWLGLPVLSDAIIDILIIGTVRESSKIFNVLIVSTDIVFKYWAGCSLFRADTVVWWVIGYRS